MQEKKGGQNISDRQKESEAHDQSSLIDHVLETLCCITNSFARRRLPEMLGIIGALSCLVLLEVFWSRVGKDDGNLSFLFT